MVHQLLVYPPLEPSSLSSINLAAQILAKASHEIPSYFYGFMSLTHHRVKPLTEHNYAAWSKQAAALLKAKNLSKFALGKNSVLAAADSISSEDKEKLEQAMGELELTIGTEQAYLVDQFKDINKNDPSKTEDPFHLWAYLKDKLAGKSEAREAHLKKQLSTLESFYATRPASLSEKFRRHKRK